ncbi:hypothetical protein QLX08_006189 [Tetragonisca angustula]|uniref:Uncharacterized protein n=1 Tax=Tetragonisca angustula TaxID=166442 RepID=A0AAW0ZUT6_9HYME
MLAIASCDLSHNSPKRSPMKRAIITSTHSTTISTRGILSSFILGMAERNGNQSRTPDNEEETATAVEEGKRTGAFKGCIELMTMVPFASGPTRKRISASRR